MKIEKIYKIMVVCVVLLMISLIWWVLELIFYGAIQPRIVDDIVFSMFIPFVWNSVNVKVGGKA